VEIGGDGVHRRGRKTRTVRVCFERNNKAEPWAKQSRWSASQTKKGGTVVDSKGIETRRHTVGRREKKAGQRGRGPINERGKLKGNASGGGGELKTQRDDARRGLKNDKDPQRGGKRGKGRTGNGLGEQKPGGSC